MEAKMGRNRVVVATLLVHSVNTAMSKDKIKVMAAGGTACKGSICFPIHSDSPETWEAPRGQPPKGYWLTVPAPHPSPGSSAHPLPLTLSAHIPG